LLVGKEREDWLKGEYAKYNERERISNVLVLLAILVFFPLTILLPSLDLPEKGLLSEIFAIVTLVSLLGGVRLSASAVKLLPPVEERVLYYLKSALVHLKAYAINGEDSKKKAIDDLMEVAGVLDNWTWGNLKFVRNGIGAEIEQFRKNFRGRLIPAIRKADKRNVQSFFQWFAGVENSLELNQLDLEHLRAWNMWLTQRHPQDSMKDTLPYETPRPSRVERLRSQRFQFTLVLGLGLSPVATGVISFYGFHTTVDTAVLAGTSAFTGLALVVVGLLTLRKQKSS
jgi:hypothetical protein